MDRRDFLRSAVAAAGTLAFGSSFWRAAASHAEPLVTAGPYGPPGTPDENGVRLPSGFRSRIIARGGQPVGSTSYAWPYAPDGGATFATDDGGWIYVCNSELSRVGGASAIRFAADASIVSAYRILGGTNRNCAGGVTPWGTWLSCEEDPGGLVWECDPSGAVPAIARPALGSFTHEAAVVDPQTSYVYMTEDDSEGAFYRFRPDERVVPDPVGLPVDVLRTGTLEIMKARDADALATGSAVEWIPVTVQNAVQPPGFEVLPPVRDQVPDRTRFARGEGCWFDTVARTVYFSTTSDNRIWAYEVDAGRIHVLFDGSTASSPLRNPDNLTVSPSGDMFICEDGDNLEMVLLTRDGEVATFLQVHGGQHTGSEITGAAFDPSGTRLYFSSQRGAAVGITYEVTGPFRTTRAA